MASVVVASDLAARAVVDVDGSGCGVEVALRWAGVVRHRNAACTPVWSDGNARPAGPFLAGASLNNPVGAMTRHARPRPIHR